MAAKPINSRIAGVTVYRQGARVTRTAEVGAGDAGFPATIRLTGLPLALRDDTVRVRVTADDAASGSLPTAVDIKIALDVPEVDDSLRPADDADLEAARARVATLAGEVRQLDRELARIDELQLSPRSAGAEGEPPRASPFDSRLALLDVRQRIEQRLNGELRAKRDELRTAERGLEDLEDQERRASHARQAREHELRKTVIVTLAPPTGSEPAASAQFALDYLVPGARWAPAYAVYFDNALSTAELRMRASVAQDTGEDWTGVPLTLSTADAQGWHELPELRSIRIGRYQPPLAKAGWRPPPTGVGELYGDYDRSFRDRFYDKHTPEPLVEARKSASDTGSFPVPRAHHREETQPFAPQDLDALDEDMAVFAVAAGPADDFSEITREQAPARRAKKKKKRGRAPAAKSYSPGPMSPASAPPPMAGGGPPMQQSSQLFGASSFAAPEAAAAAEPEISAALRVQDDMLAYAGLRMPSPRSAKRGSLIVASQTEVYLELLVKQNVEISFDVVAAVERANQRAHRVGSLKLPTHGRFVWSEDYDYAYVTDMAVDVPSDGALHSIPLTGKAGACKLNYVVVPRESCDVFRQAEVSNPLAAPLLPGPVDVYKAGDFLLTSAVKFTPPQASVLLGLGVEQRVKVSRNTKYREDTTGLIKGSLQLNHQIDVEAINLLDHDVNLEIRERVPALKDDEDDIKLSVKDVSPAWQEWDPFPDRAESRKLKGGYRWRVTLAANDKRQFAASYEVRISSKHQLVGGNRREV